MIKAVLTAGLYANVAVGDEASDQDYAQYTWKDATSEVRVHPSSVNKGIGVDTVHHLNDGLWHCTKFDA